MSNIKACKYMGSGYLRKAGLEVSNGELSFIYLKTVSPVTTNRLYSHNLKIFSNPKKFQKKIVLSNGPCSFTHRVTFAPPNFVRRTNTVIVILLIRKQSSEMKAPCPQHTTVRGGTRLPSRSLSHSPRV